MGSGDGDEPPNISVLLEKNLDCSVILSVAEGFSASAALAMISDRVPSKTKFFIVLLRMNSTGKVN